MMSAPGMIPVGGPMHPGMQQQPTQAQQQSHVQQQQQSHAQQQHAQQQQSHAQQQNLAQQQMELRYDHVNKVKALIWALKESFGTVMKVAGARVNHMMIPGKTEDIPPRFDKTLEDFFSICNQIELHLKAILECTMQNKDSAHYVPLNVTLGKQDTGPSQDGNLSYAQYIATMKAQVNFAKSVQDILTEGVRSVIKTEN